MWGEGSVCMCMRMCNPEDHYLIVRHVAYLSPVYYVIYVVVFLVLFEFVFQMQFLQFFNKSSSDSEVFINLTSSLWLLSKQNGGCYLIV